MNEQDNTTALVERMLEDGRRTNDTRDQYRRRGEQLLARYLRVVGFDLGGGVADAVAFASWYAAKRSTYKPSTWRVYKQAIIMMAIGWPNTNMHEVCRILEDAARPQGKLPTRTSGRKSKKIPIKHFLELCSYLTRSSATRSACDARTWLIAGVATGLRPGEWRVAQIIHQNDRVFLVHLREKTTNGRGLGDFGVLDLTELRNMEIEAITKMAILGAVWRADREFTRKQEAAGQLIRDACRSLWPKKPHYSLYSCRHQATANFKSTMSAEEVAALLGHTVTTTMVGYGRKRSAWFVDKEFIPPKPSPELVLRVRKTTKSFRPRTELELKADTLIVTQGLV